VEINFKILSLAFRFYARSLQFPFDELTHEYQHLFREMEKNVASEFDEEIAGSILDIINYYQGEEMSALQAEYSRVFSFTEGEVPMVPMFSKDYLPPAQRDDLIETFHESAIFLDMETDADSIQNILDYFAILLEEENFDEIDRFLQTVIHPVMRDFCSYLYQSTVLNFYKELAKGLNALVQNLLPPESD
jgi:TorA maturation chaperone TorD